MTLKEVCPGIFMVTERSWLPQFRPTVNLYVITGTDGLVFDAGYGNRNTIRLFVKEFHRIGEICRDRGEPCSVRRILVSHAHPDHFAGLRRLRKELGLSVLLTRPVAELISSRRAYRTSYDARYMENELLGRSLMKRALLAVTAPLASMAYELLYGTNFVPDPDGIIDERGSISINGEAWSIFPSPGHSTDHISLYDPARGSSLPVTTSSERSSPGSDRRAQTRPRMFGAWRNTWRFLSSMSFSARTGARCVSRHSVSAASSPGAKKERAT